MELQEFGKELRQMRKEMGMTQEKLAEALDTNFRVVSRWEKGEDQMGALAYKKLLKLHAEKTQKKDDDLLRQIRKLSDSDRLMIEQMIRRVSGSSGQ